MRLLVGLLSVWLIAAAQDVSDAAKKDMALLDGEWSMISGERDGQSLPEEFVKESKRVAKDGVTTTTIAGELFMKAKFTLDPSKKPKAIDYVMLAGPTKGKSLLGIYEINGDTAKFCFAPSGKERPGDFTAKAGSGRTASSWRKVK